MKLSKIYNSINKKSRTFYKEIKNDKELSDILNILTNLLSYGSNVKFELRDSIIEIEFGSETGLKLFYEWKQKLKADF